MKHCNKCNLDKVEEEFTKSTMCTDCYNKYARYYYSINKEKHKVYVKNWSIKNKELIKSYRQTKEHKAKRKKYYDVINKEQRRFINSCKTPCVVCGEYEKVCIDFHHLNPKTKSFCLCSTKRRNICDILAEINKCICLCSNCHRLVSAEWIKLNEAV